MSIERIAEVIRRVQIPPGEFTNIGFYVIAPESRIKDGIFAEHMAPDKMRRIVRQRVNEYAEPEKNLWFEEWFIPMMDSIRIREVSWEEVVSLIKQFDSTRGADLSAFYEKCLKFNR